MLNLLKKLVSSYKLNMRIMAYNVAEMVVYAENPKLAVGLYGFITSILTFFTFCTIGYAIMFLLGWYALSIFVTSYWVLLQLVAFHSHYAKACDDLQASKEILEGQKQQTDK